jgi:dTDP-4-amino-4,6-dideoxygalactose transaminase
MSWRHVAPAGTPIGLPTLGAWARRLASRRDAVAELADALCARQGATYCLPASTGRAALVLILRALSRLAAPDRNEVVIPSYTCYTVASSVMVSGLRPRVVDIDPSTLDFDRTALGRTDFSRVLAIVATNLFGLPSDMPALTALAREHGVYLVDDAAQSLGAMVGGRPSGMWGDAGLYSLDKGKNITAIEGGFALTADRQVAAILREESLSLHPPGTASIARDVLKLLVYAAFLPPRLYWIPNGIPWLGLGETPYLREIPLERYNHALAAMGLVMLGRLEAVNRERCANAGRLSTLVADVPGFQPIRVLEDASAVYLRYPLLAETRELRDHMFRELRAHGIGATASYPTAIVDIPELEAVMAEYAPQCPGGREVAQRLLTLPTHPFVSPSDLDVIHKVLVGRTRTAGATRLAAAAPRH